MGKKARLKKQRRDGAVADAPSAAQLVDRFLRSINAPATIADRGAFWDWLDARHGPESAYLSDVLDGLVADSKWGARCATLGLSIDHQFAFSGRLYRPLLRALAQRLSGAEYGSVLDLGCENALVGCFVASLQPDARLVGMDAEARGLRAAAQLAEQLSLTAEFHKADLTSPQWPVSGPFDVVLSMRALVGNALGQRGFSAEDEALNAVLRRIRELVAAGGRFIAFERLQDAEQSHRFATAAARQGFAFDAEEAAVLVVEEIPGSVERIPLWVFTAVEGGSAPDVAVLEDLHARAARAAGATL